jgi:S-adenosylmethionine:tRNA ribosyltransferase-isomerase
MKDYRSIKIEDYTYDLPEERIAKYPKKNRDESKLLHFSDGEISTSIFKDLPDLLKTDDLLVFNNAKVIQATFGFSERNGCKY